MKYIKILLASCALAGFSQAATIAAYTGPQPPQPTLNSGNDAFYYTGVNINYGTSTPIQNTCQSPGCTTLDSVPGPFWKYTAK